MSIQPLYKVPQQNQIIPKQAISQTQNFFIWKHFWSFSHLLFRIIQKLYFFIFHLDEMLLLRIFLIFLSFHHDWDINIFFLYRLHVFFCLRFLDDYWLFFNNVWSKFVLGCFIVDNFRWFSNDREMLLKDWMLTNLYPSNPTLSLRIKNSSKQVFHIICAVLH